MADTPWRAGRLGRGDGRPRVLFGWSYEDERVELAAFGPPGPARRVCVIASSGETAAACAAAGHRVVAVDINPTQLEYARGRVDDGAPVVTGTAERGMMAGRAALALIAPGWRRTRVQAVLSRSPEEVSAYWRAALDRLPLRLLLGAALRPGAALAGLLRPEFADFVPDRFDLALRRRIGDGLDRHGGGSRFTWRLLTGTERPGWTVPVPTSPIEWRHADIIAFLESEPARSFDGISLSNVTDGAPAEFAERLRAATRRAVRPGGAVVSRSFAVGPLDTDDAALLWGTVRIERASIPGASAPRLATD
ncbi:MAG: hypothetical protein ACR2LI_01910 [Propionibacteriaceae bacterium]